MNSVKTPFHRKDKLNVAVIGAGHWGPNIIRNFLEDPRVNMRIICDKDTERLKVIATRYESVETTINLIKILKDSSIQAVAICTPTATHFSIAKACLQHNKHILVEKPMASSSAKCAELIELAETQKLKIMVGHVFLFNPGIRYIYDLIHQGDLGDIIYIYATRVNLGPVRTDVNAMWDLAPHDISILNYWLGCQPLQAHAIGTEYINKKLDDVVFITLKYPSNILANIHVSWLDPRKTRQIVIVGTKKMVVFDDLDTLGSVYIYDKSVTKTPDPRLVADTIQDFKVVIQEDKLTIPKIPQGEPLKAECRAFIDYLLGLGEGISTADTGIAVVRTLEAATQSLKAGGQSILLETDIPSTTEFINSETRPMCFNATLTGRGVEY